MTRFASLLAVLVALVAAAPASAGVGALSQPAGTAACVSATGSGGKCAQGAGLATPEAVAVSPDGRNVYVAGFTGWTIAIFTRDPATGALTETGCQSAVSDPGCTTVSEGAIDADSLAVSPDGKTLYAGSSIADTVSAFPRDPATGALGPAYCFGVKSFAGCSHSGARALQTTSGVAVGPDSKSVFATSITDRAIAELAHDDATGQLTQSAGTDGCISRDGSAFWPGHQSGIYCASMYSWGFQTPRNLTVAPDGKSVLVADSSAGLMDYDRAAGGVSDRVCYGPGAGCQLAHGVKAAWDVTTTPDGKGIYVASASPGGVAAFNRDPATGSLVQSTFTSGNPPHPSSGCINQDASDGCTQGRAVAGALGVVVSPDGQNVYVNGEASGAIAAFGRDAGTNQLDQLDGADGCLSYNGSGGLCSEGKLMESIKDIAASPDGKNIYAVSQNNQAVLVFDRDTTPPPTPGGGGAPSGGGGPSGGDGGATGSASGSATTAPNGRTQGGAGSPGGEGTTAACTVSVPAVQRKLVKRVLTTTVTCDRSATVAETATLTTGAAAKRANSAKPIALGATSATVGAGARATVGLKLTRRADAALLRAIRRHRRYRVRVSITATAAAGATSTAAAAARKLKLAKAGGVSPRSGA
jgi:DNA-binding beta-propeller fold protein YncE